MPKPKALSAAEARRTLVHRFGPRVNRLRQIAVNFGLRPYRVWLVWFQWTGENVGEGTEVEYRREEILPTPEFFNNTRLLFLNAGYTNDGSMELRRVDPTLAEAMLRGQLYPGQVIGSPCPDEGGKPPSKYMILVKEDNRSEGEVLERWFVLNGTPYRRAGQLDWNVKLQEVSK